MELYNISILKKDKNQDGLYDMIEPTFILKELPQLQMIVSNEQEMRIDLISFEIYKSVDYADLILDLNDIDNPLNIKSGDYIRYIPLEQLDYYRISPNTTKEKRSLLLSPNKSNKKDPNRQEYIENNYQLPPTFLETPSSPVTTDKNTIKISPIR
jgi:hypothetical protein